MAVIRTETACSQVLIVDDHPLFNDALASALIMIYPEARIEKAGSLAEALSLIEKGFAPDLVLFDLKLPDVTGISGFLSVQSHLPNVPILVISALASLDLVQSLLKEGAAGFLPKESSIDELRDAIEKVVAGEAVVPQEYRIANAERIDEICQNALNSKLAVLTPQQRKIVRLICEGKPNKQIAYELSLAEATVKAHVTALLRRLKVRNRTQVAVMMEASLARDEGSDQEARAFVNH